MPTDDVREERAKELDEQFNRSKSKWDEYQKNFDKFLAKSKADTEMRQAQRQSMLEAYIENERNFQESFLGKINGWVENQKDQFKSIEEAQAETKRALEKADEKLKRIEN